MKSNKIVLGAGLSGLGLLHKHKGARCFEKNLYPFGHASSHKIFDEYFDEGAHICHSKNENWLKKLDLKKCVKHTKANVKNYHNGKWFGYPIQNNLYFLSSEVQVKILKEIYNNSIRSKHIELNNYYEWCINTYGITLTKDYYELFTRKYWRSEMSELGVNWLGGRLIPLNFNNVLSGLCNSSYDQSVFKEYYYPKEGGFQDLFKNILSQDISERISYGNSCNEINHVKKILCTKNEVIPYSKLFNTIPLKKFVNLCRDVPDYVRQASEKLKYNKLFTLAVKFNHIPEEIPDWFYVYDEDIDISRVFNNTKVSQRRSNYLYLQCETFRRNDEEYDVEKIKCNMIKGIEKIIGYKSIDSELLFSEYSYVVPTLDTANLVKIIKNYFNEYSISHHGLYGNWEYMWSDEAFLNGRI